MAKTHRGGRFASFTIQDLLILEIFAGAARLSKTARDAGLQVIPIDKTSDRASQIQIALYDLTEPVELQSLTELLRSEAHRILAVHFAPGVPVQPHEHVRKNSLVCNPRVFEFHSHFDPSGNRPVWTSCRESTRFVRKRQTSFMKPRPHW